MVSVVIPNWNGEEVLGACLDSVTNQTLRPDVIVVDNGSRDNSPRLAEDRFPGVHLVQLDENYGFAGGVNAGIAYALERGAEYIALLNNDAVAESDWLSRLQNELEHHDRAGIATAKTVYQDDPGVIDGAGEAYSIWGTPFSRGRGELDEQQYDSAEERAILAASGGATLYRADVFRRVGMFDGWFFAYYEDVDLSLRAQLQGWGVRYVAEAVVQHQVGTTSSQVPNLSLYHQTKNFLPLFIKNMPGRFFWYYGWRVLGVFGFKLLQLLKKGKLKVLAKVLGALLWHLPTVLHQRRHIQNHRRVNPSSFDERLYHAPPPSQPGLRRVVAKLGLR